MRAIMSIMKAQMSIKEDYHHGMLTIGALKIPFPCLAICSIQKTDVSKAVLGRSLNCLDNFSAFFLYKKSLNFIKITGTPLVTDS